MAGIAASLKLAQAGFRVTLLEAKRRLGGRAGSYSPNDSGDDQIDYCQHVGMGCCHALQQLIEMLDQQEQWTRHRELHFYGPSGRYSKLGALPLLPAPLHIGHWIFKWPDLSLPDRMHVARGMLALSQLDIQDPNSHDVPAITWLKENGQTESCIAAFWTTVIVSALGEQTDRVSLYSVAKVFQDGFLGARDAFHLLVPQRPLDELFNFGAMASLKKAGVDVRLSCPLKAIAPRQASKHSRGFEIMTPDHVFHADELIVALPWHQISRLCPQIGTAQLTALEDFLKVTGENCQQLGSSPITGVHTWWDGPWLETQHATIVNRLCQWVFPKPTVNLTSPWTQPKSSGVAADLPSSTRNSLESSQFSDSTYYQIVISASRDLSSLCKAELSHAIHEDLGQVFPKAKRAKLLRCEAVTDPNSVFSVRSGSAAFRPDQKTEIPGLWLAGDWTQTGWPATMEGAILSGFSAAGRIMGQHQH